MPAVTQIAKAQGNPRLTLPCWEHDLAGALLDARSKHVDVKFVFSAMRMTKSITELARLLWPALLRKSEREYADDEPTTPVVRLVMEVRRVIAPQTGIFGLKGPSKAS
ncbi:hypothetical protein GCM10009853_032040 [Glycomyces scopariae]